MRSHIDRVPNGTHRSGGITVAAATLSLSLALSACSSSSDTPVDDDDSEVIGGNPELQLDRVENGFGLLLPHRAAVLDTAGQPTGEVELLRSAVAITNVLLEGRQLLPPAVFPSDALLPSGASGNHYFLARFDAEIQPLSVFQDDPSNPGPPLQVRAVSEFGDESVVPSRAFVGGMELVNGALVEVVGPGATSSELVVLDPRGAGFPGTETPFAGAADLLSPSSVVIVADTDGNLATHETFPVGVSLRLHIGSGLLGVNGPLFQDQGVATTTVGADQVPPLWMRRGGEVVMTPADGDTGVSPDTNIEVTFSESIDPLSIGSLDGPGVSPSVLLRSGPSNFETVVPFQVSIVRPYDLTRLTLVPSGTFPGLSPEDTQPNSALGFVTVQVGNAASGSSNFRDLAATPNVASLDALGRFQVGVGQGLVNAPIMPEAIYALRGGGLPSLSVIDLNGFGQSTGNHVLTGAFPLEGESRFEFNPNLFQPTIRPLLAAGTTSLDGGSAGVFTLTLDSNLSDRLAIAPTLVNPQDMHAGATLDQIFSNGPAPFGCQAGAGNVCALTGLKTVDGAGNPIGVHPNLISASPHPNPPRLVFPPLCVLPHIAADEPTSIDNAGLVNLLQPGDPFGDLESMTPPTGTLPNAQGDFAGPSFGQTETQNCAPFAVSQQLGHLLYVADRTRGEVVVLNSNRMTVVERIQVPDATSLAIDPNLRWLAVSSPEFDTVTILSIHPAAADFHTVLREVPVGDGPRGLAVEPHGEDLIVCNEAGGTLSIIEPVGFTVRKTVPALVDQPFEVAVTPRMEGFAFNRGVYFAYVLGRDGQVGFFESGPDGVDGIGFDTTVGVVPFTFQNPKAIQVDLLNRDASVYVAYEGPVDTETGEAGDPGVGAISRLRIESALSGAIPIAASAGANFRDVEFGVPLTLSQAAGELTGIPVDLAFDERANRGDLPGPTSSFSTAMPASFNSKATYRQIGDTSVVASRPQFLLAAMADVGAVDVLQLGLTDTPRLDVNIYQDGVQSVRVPDVRGLVHYWRQ